MHILVRFLVASFLANAGLGQPCFAESTDNIRISKLVIESSSLPSADCERIIRLFQQKTYFQPEIGDRIRSALRDLGYFKAVVDEPRFSFPTQVEGRRVTNVTVKVEPGAQYRLGEIHVEKATVFPSARLRNLFSLRRGDLFNATKIGKGLEDLRKLYATEGYVDCVATPEVVSDDLRHTVDLVIFMDEGRPYDFGKLYLEGLEGIEPHAGAGKALLNSWKTLEGKRYNPLELHRWLLANQADWKMSSDSMRVVIDSESLAVNVRLTQWPN